MTGLGLVLLAVKSPIAQGAARLLVKQVKRAEARDARGGI